MDTEFNDWFTKLSSESVSPEKGDPYLFFYTPKLLARDATH